MKQQQTMKVTHKHAAWIKGESLIRFGRYGNGRIAIQLVDAETGEPNTVATVNLPEEEMPYGTVAIKNYSENEGILQDLIDNGIVGDPVSVCPSGFTMVQICPLKVTPPKAS